MKKDLLILLSLVLNAILVLAVIILFARVFSNSGATSEKQTVLHSDSVCYNKLPVAYINIDSLLLKYELASELREALIKKMEDARYEISSKMQNWQKDVQDHQRKLETSSYLSRERAEQTEMALVKRQQEIQERESKLQQELMKQEQNMSERLRDTINSFLRDYNIDKKYEFIFSNTSNDNILLAADSYNITQEAITILNSRYKKK